MELRSALRSACVDAGWHYAVFWRPRESPPRVSLFWEDAFHVLASPSAGSTPEGTALKQGDAPALDRGLLLNALARMSADVHRLGQGVIGRAALTGQRQWIFAPPPTQLRSSMLSPSWSLQFAAGIQTVAAVPVAGGVLQVGSSRMIPESPKLAACLAMLFSSLKFGAKAQTPELPLASPASSPRGLSSSSPEPPLPALEKDSPIVLPVGKIQLDYFSFSAPSVTSTLSASSVQHSRGVAPPMGQRNRLQALKQAREQRLQQQQQLPAVMQQSRAAPASAVGSMGPSSFDELSQALGIGMTGVLPGASSPETKPTVAPCRAALPSPHQAEPASQGIDPRSYMGARPGHGRSMLESVARQPAEDSMRKPMEDRKREESQEPYVTRPAGLASLADMGLQVEASPGDALMALDDRPAPGCMALESGASASLLDPSSAPGVRRPREPIGLDTALQGAVLMVEGHLRKRLRTGQQEPLWGSLQSIGRGRELPGSMASSLDGLAEECSAQQLAPDALCMDNASSGLASLYGRDTMSAGMLSSSTVPQSRLSECTVSASTLASLRASRPASTMLDTSGESVSGPSLLRALHCGTLGSLDTIPALGALESSRALLGWKQGLGTTGSALHLVNSRAMLHSGALDLAQGGALLPLTEPVLMPQPQALHLGAKGRSTMARSLAQAVENSTLLPMYKGGKDKGGSGEQISPGTRVGLVDRDACALSTSPDACAPWAEGRSPPGALQNNLLAARQSQGLSPLSPGSRHLATLSSAAAEAPVPPASRVISANELACSIAASLAQPREQGPGSGAAAGREGPTDSADAAGLRFHSQRSCNRGGAEGRIRPRDRQLIQDRLQDLRDLLPGAAKLSIEMLLERTMQRICFLRQATQQQKAMIATSIPQAIPSETPQAESGPALAASISASLMLVRVKWDTLASPFFDAATWLQRIGLVVRKGTTYSGESGTVLQRGRGKCSFARLPSKDAGLYGAVSLFVVENPNAVTCMEAALVVHREVERSLL